MVRVKVCGLTREVDLRAAVDAGADAVGVVSDVSVDTPREVDAERARDLLATAPPFVATVLVTIVDDPDATVALANAVDPDVLQVHGDLDAAAVARLREESGVRVMPVVTCEDGDRARALDGVADAVLVDSESEAGGGGTGRTHDWDATAAIVDTLDAPVVLAGGLTPDNVAEAVARVDPFAVDVASGVESAGGRKDHGALAAFVEAATGGPGAHA